MEYWHHAPTHKFNEKGTYIITAATLQNIHHFRKYSELQLVQELILEYAHRYGWNLEAWAVFSNHYHFVAQSPDNPESLPKFLKHLHATISRRINELHKRPGRTVWHNYWDTRLTYEKSYFARLNYVMKNPVKHKLVECASDYDFCSAKWFKTNASKSYFNAIDSFKIDEVNVIDDFDCEIVVDS